MESKRILLLGSQARSLVLFRGALIRELVAVGHSVVACAPDLDSETSDLLIALGAEPVETPMSRTGLNPMADLSYMAEIRRIIRAQSPDYVISYTIKPNIWGAMAAKAEGVPSAAMITGLGYAFTEITGLKHTIIAKLANRLYRMGTARNDIVVFQNPDDRRDFIDAGCLATPEKARLMNGSGVDIDHFKPVPLPDKPVFLMISRLLGNKGVREYAAAAELVKERNPDCRCLLIGSRDESPDGLNESEIENLGAQGVEYLGPKSDVREIIAQASCCVLPSYREGTPRSVLEAMAMGRAIITSDAPGCRETTIHGDNGLLVPPRDVPALVQAMLAMADNHTMCAAMGKRSRHLAIKKFDDRKVNGQLLRDLSLAA